MESTVVKALRILEVIALQDQVCTVTDVARVCKITKSNAHRLLKTLEGCHYVRQDPFRKTYEPTLRLWELGVRVFGRVDIRLVAEPHLRTLAESTNESVHLSVFDAGEVIYVDKVESTHAVRAYIRIGDRAPAYCTATGRAMLAYLPADTVAAVCRDLRTYTANTIADAPTLERELAAVRRRGYAVTYGEWREGVTGIAAPVRSEAGAVVAGVGIAGPEDRMRRAETAAQASAVRRTAAAISRDLGFIGDGVADTADATQPEEAAV